jgi:hypothetical protein
MQLIVTIAAPRGVDLRNIKIAGTAYENGGAPLTEWIRDVKIELTSDFKII